MLMRNLRALLLGLAILAGLSACGSATSAPTQVNVFAAASLTDAFQAAAHAFQAEHPELEIVLNTAGSQQLAQQIIAGAPADVFASANIKQLQVLADAGLVDAATQAIFASNRLTIIVPAQSSVSITGLASLAQPGLRLVLAAEAVPVGQYSREVLQKARAVYGAEFPAAVLANVRSNEQNVRAVLSKVALGEADAGIVYTTDAASSKDVALIDIPDALNVVAVYPLTRVRTSAHPEAAKQFVDYLLSPAGQAILRSYGFGAPAAAGAQP